MKIRMLPVIALAMSLGLAGCQEEEGDENETEEVEEAEEEEDD